MLKKIAKAIPHERVSGPGERRGDAEFHRCIGTLAPQWLPPWAELPHTMQAHVTAMYIKHHVTNAYNTDHLKGIFCQSCFPQSARYLPTR